MKFTISYRNQFIISLVWIFIVMAIFNTVPSLEIAALITSIGFVLIPTLFLLSEALNEQNSTHMTVLSFFILLAALPVCYVRIMNWGVEFNTLKILGIFPAQDYHNIARFFYVAVVASSFMNWFKELKID